MLSQPSEQRKLQEINAIYEQAESKLQDAIALLQEQIESLTQQLENSYQETQVLEQELSHTNQELSNLNQENQELYAGQQKLTLSQARILAQSLLDQGKPTSEALARLLSEIYQVQVAPEEFAQKARSSSLLNPYRRVQQARIFATQRQLKTQFNELKTLFSELGEKFDDLS
ncbi:MULTISPECIES: hypothetical protein [Trichocoleus]|uniref:Chromosome partition protein Smc n=1 Tax=Trichocoleus desertorum GB2-A4 TaxID=2933944 RepID=A0ABV0J886_9CYAN|nr:hypothetical protein [Trichocoleus sp. FACHB-46]MBD1860997.1 hypothetical protein [Trichocoleus sp. FACHB-46]